jgi:hypothetical protein
LKVQKATFKTLWDTNKQHFGWDSRAQPPTASAGCFEIDTDTNFMVSDNLLIGMAMDPPSGGDGPVPVACVSKGLLTTFRIYLFC